MKTIIYNPPNSYTIEYDIPNFVYLKTPGKFYVHFFKFILAHLK